MRLKLTEIDVKILYVVEDFSQSEKIETCINKFMEHCVVTDSLVKGLPINIECKKKN